MYRVVYLNQRSFTQYDDAHLLVYINEEVLPDYLPEDAPEDMSPVTAYAYSGNMEDGGTLIEASSADRNSLIDAVLRTRYSQSEEDAIKTHQLILLQNPESDKAEEYQDEWSEFLAFREQTISLVDDWLS